MNFSENVRTTTVDDYIIDTAHILVEADYFETAISLNYGDWVVVEYASTKKEAQDMHDKWVEYVKNNKPIKLVSCQTNREEVL